MYPLHLYSAKTYCYRGLRVITIWLLQRFLIGSEDKGCVANDSIELSAVFIPSDLAYVIKNDVAFTKCCEQQHQQATDRH
jgi:hypothetical protein